MRRRKKKKQFEDLSTKPKEDKPKVEDDSLTDMENLIEQAGPDIKYTSRGK